METDRWVYMIQLDGMSTESILDYIKSQEDLAKAACTHLEIAWETLYNRGDSEHK
jgi:hypothetical protein